MSWKSVWQQHRRNTGKPAVSLPSRPMLPTASARTVCCGRISRRDFGVGFFPSATGRPPPERLAAQILRECSQRGFRGVAADFERPPSTDRIALLRALVRRCGKHLQVFVPESCAVEGASVLINTAVSGGSLAERLQEAIQRHPGASLDLQRLMMDFTLPSPSGEGKPLTAEELAELRRRHGPSVFFSPELCARYFTYREGRQVHFVLFDDAGTLQQKMRMAESLGYRAALMMYPEVRDIAEQLFPAAKSRR